MHRSDTIETQPKGLFVTLPGLDYFYATSKNIISQLPKTVQKDAKSLVLKVENYADNETLQSLQITDRYDLLGLYRGVPLSAKVKKKKSLDIIFLYRAPLIRYAKEHEEDLSHIIRHVILHELGHHLGCSSNEILSMSKH